MDLERRALLFLRDGILRLKRGRYRYARRCVSASALTGYGETRGLPRFIDVCHIEGVLDGSVHVNNGDCLS